jgi:two-component system sensor histidine kinase TctE
VAQRSPNDLRALHLDEPPSELAAVLAALNRLFERVQRATQALQRFHANVAHQLRTPLTGLRTQIELAEMEGAFAGHEARRHRIDQALDQLGHLIDQLLSLARAEAGAQQLPGFAPLNLATLVEQRATAFVDQAVARQIDLGFALDDTPPVRGSAVLLGELIANLVDNALRYCPPGSTVTVSCGRDDDGTWLAVEDDGPGIDPAQREQVFDRFYRAEAGATEGSGLGLAIVREIAQLHETQVQVKTPASGHGVRMELRWPQPHIAT